MIPKLLLTVVMFCHWHYIIFIMIPFIDWRKHFGDEGDFKEEDRKIRHEIVHSFECKICKDVPTDPILMMCCKQILGCQGCLQICLRNNDVCPLCRQLVLGLDSLLATLRSVRSN